MKRARGFIDLLFDVVEQTTNLVERTHNGVVKRSVRRFAPVQPLTNAAVAVTGIEGMIAGTVFKSIRGINGLTRASISSVADVAAVAFKEELESDRYELATPMESSAAGSVNWCVDYAQSALNGFWGDYLSERKNPLATEMTLRHHGRILEVSPEALSQALPAATGKVCVFVHGLASTEWMWNISSAAHYQGDASVSYGSRLQEDLGYTPLYVRYNSGRHISESGRDLSALLGELLEAYPVAIEDIILVGHSMGGLVTRSATSYASEEDAPWVKRLRHVACIGAPNLGAPLEKAVNVLTGMLRHVDAAAAQVPTEILNGRSAGVKDLRYGYTRTQEWQGKDPDAVFSNARLNMPLLEGVGYHYFAATLSETPERPLGKAMDKVLGDLLVPIASASGAASNAAEHIPFSGGKVFPGMNHLHILNHPDIYNALRDALVPGQTLALH